MAKVTQQDVISFLKEKVVQLTKELATSQNALNALEGFSSSDVPAKKPRKPKAEVKSLNTKRKYTARANGAKRGRKPKAQATSSEEPIVE